MLSKKEIYIYRTKLLISIYHFITIITDNQTKHKKITSTVKNFKSFKRKKKLITDIFFLNNIKEGFK